MSSCREQKTPTDAEGSPRRPGVQLTTIAVPDSLDAWGKSMGNAVEALSASLLRPGGLTGKLPWAGASVDPGADMPRGLATRCVLKTRLRPARMVRFETAAFNGLEFEPVGPGLDAHGFVEITRQDDGTIWCRPFPGDAAILRRQMPARARFRSGAISFRLPGFHRLHRLPKERRCIRR